MASRFTLTPGSAEFPATNFPQLTLINRRPILSYNGTTNQAAQWTVVLPAGWTGTITAYIFIIMASDTSGDTDWDVSVEAITTADTTDLDAGDSFDTVNSTDNTTVPSVAGYLQRIAVTLANHDSSAAGDCARIRVTRDAASDAANGLAYLLAVEIQDGA